MEFRFTSILKVSFFCIVLLTFRAEASAALSLRCSAFAWENGKNRISLSLNALQTYVFIDLLQSTPAHRTCCPIEFNGFRRNIRRQYCFIIWQNQIRVQISSSTESTAGQSSEQELNEYRKHRMCCQLWGGCKINKNILYEQEAVDRHPNPNATQHTSNRTHFPRYSSSKCGAFSVVGIYRCFFGNILDRGVVYCSMFIYSLFSR